ncbi:hypothetical protein [Nonomuraea sp. WAC 01424]|nr:hypothetical protein [Nonomuraea sp. WAC 01424]
MPKVRIHTKGDRDPIELDVAPGDEEFYDNLPFDSDNVMITEIH